MCLDSGFAPLARPGMMPVDTAGAGHFQIHMSNSPRVSAHHAGIIDAGVIHRPRKKSGAGRRLLFFAPSK